MTRVARYLVPGAYLLDSRLTNLPERVSWLLINPAVIAYLAVRFSAASTASTLVVFVLAWLAWQSIYETGYLENDVVTTRWERHPTLRFSRDVRGELSRHLRVLVLGKALIGVVAMLVAEQVGGGGFSGTLFVILVAITRLVFLAHNRLRSRWNVVTYLALATLKYATIPLAVAPGDDRLWVLAIAVVLFPVLRTLEHATKAKYQLPALHAWVHPVWRFRLQYYAVLCAVMVTGWRWADGRAWSVGAGAAVYLLVLRAFSGIVDRRLDRRVPEAYRLDPEASARDGTGRRLGDRDAEPR